ncbi:MAG: hypothetical protein ACRDQ7_26970 [Haloechinothrix sp.]
MLLSRAVTYTKGYRKAGPTLRYQFDEKELVAHLTGQLDPTSRGNIGRHDTVQHFTEALRALEDRPSAASELLERLDNWGGTGVDCIHNVLEPKLPRSSTSTATTRCRARSPSPT